MQQATRGRFGVCVALAPRGAQVSPSSLRAVGVDWYLNWTATPEATLKSVAFVPQISRRRGETIGRAEIAALIDHNPDAYPDGTVWMVGNEIGYGPDRRTPAEYANDFHAAYQALKAVNATFEVSVGATVLSRHPLLLEGCADPAGGVAFLRSVLNEYATRYGQAMPAKWVAATAYVAPTQLDGVNGSLRRVLALRHHHLPAGRFLEQIRELRAALAEAGMRDRCVLVSEVGAPFRWAAPNSREDFLREVIDVCANARDDTIGCPNDDNRLVQRSAWFLAQPTSARHTIASLGAGALTIAPGTSALLDTTGQPTHLGQLHAQHVATHGS